MALIKRLRRLFLADFHAVLDHVEEPDSLLRQAIREMEEALADDEQRFRSLQLEREQLTSKDIELRQLLESLREELEICLDADKEELARSLIRRRLETERSLTLLMQRRESLDKQLGQLGVRLDENRSRHESMRQKAQLFAEQQRETIVSDPWPAGGVCVRDEDVEVALLREYQRRASS